MAFLKILLFALLILLITGIVYLAITDVPVEQTQKTTTFTAEQFR